MKIINWKDQEVVKTPHNVDVRKIYDYENAQVMHIRLQPGEALKPHITPVNVFFYILEGIVDVRIGDETYSVSEDYLIESPAGIVHNLSNNSSSVSRIMVVKSPRPTTSTRIL
jgi:mannose-6-phosphate isomerase-like protein (cupin superfamily)